MQDPSKKEAYFLSCLPYRRKIYEEGGYRILPGQDGFMSLIENYYSGAEIKKAMRRAITLLERNDNFLLQNHPLYPPLLRQIFDPPAVLFYKGNLSQINKKYLAIVGTRSPVALTLAATEILITAMNPSQTVIVSGNARGIDRKAHEVAVSCKMATYAILGSGIGMVKNINPAITYVSEFAPDEIAHPYHFPRRNRIIAGICEKIFIMQAPYKSGARITASFALDENREIAAFDHPLLMEEGLNEGCRKLIEEGAGRIVLENMEIITQPAYSKKNLEKQLTFWQEHNAGNLYYIGKSRWIKKRKEWEN